MGADRSARPDDTRCLLQAILICVTTMTEFAVTTHGFGGKRLFPAGACVLRPKAYRPAPKAVLPFWKSVYPTAKSVRLTRDSVRPSPDAARPSSESVRLSQNSARLAPNSARLAPNSVRLMTESIDLGSKSVRQQAQSNRLRLKSTCRTPISVRLALNPIHFMPQAVSTRRHQGFHSHTVTGLYESPYLPSPFLNQAVRAGCHVLRTKRKIPTKQAKDLAPVLAFLLPSLHSPSCRRHRFHSLASSVA